MRLNENKMSCSRIKGIMTQPDNKDVSIQSPKHFRLNRACVTTVRYISKTNVKIKGEVPGERFLSFCPLSSYNKFSEKEEEYFFFICSRSYTKRLIIQNFMIKPAS